MKTAVEWLFLMMNNPNKGQEFANKLLEKAKEMEKQQIIDAYKTAEDNCEWLIEEHRWQRFHSEQYYNEKFNKSTL